LLALLLLISSLRLASSKLPALPTLLFLVHCPFLRPRFLIPAGLAFFFILLLAGAIDASALPFPFVKRKYPPGLLALFVLLLDLKNIRALFVSTEIPQVPASASSQRTALRFSFYSFFPIPHCSLGSLERISFRGRFFDTSAATL